MGFLQTPLLPKGQVTLAVVDCRLSEEAQKNLEKMGIELVKTVRCPDLYEAVDGHPDILLHHTGGRKIVIAPNVYDSLAPVLVKKGFAVTKGATWLVRNYPGNIAYNVLRIGKYAFHNTKHTDPEIVREYEKQGITIMHINQGYSKCSVCVVDENTIITSDYKISKAAEGCGIECLLIRPGGIVLKGLEYGFIGGASGLLSQKQIAFSGIMVDHPDVRRIEYFLGDRGYGITFLSSEKIYDVGSIIPLKDISNI